MICGSIEAMTQRISEPEYFMTVSHLKIQQIDNDRIDEDLITEHSEKICGVMFCHYASSYGGENSAIISFTKGSVIFFRLREAALIRHRTSRGDIVEGIR